MLSIYLNQVQTNPAVARQVNPASLPGEKSTKHRRQLSFLFRNHPSTMVTAIMETAMNKKIGVYTFPEFWSAPRIAFLFQGFQLRLDNPVMPENDPR